MKLSALGSPGGLIFQFDSLLFNFKLSSSLLKMRIIIARGVNIKKKTEPRIIGLTILLKRIPKFIHNLLKGKSKSFLKNAKNRKIAESIPKRVEKVAASLK